MGGGGRRMKDTPAPAQVASAQRPAPAQIVFLGWRPALHKKMQEGGANESPSAAIEEKKEEEEKEEEEVAAAPPPPPPVAPPLVEAAAAAAAAEAAPEEAAAAAAAAAAAEVAEPEAKAAAAAAEEAAAEEEEDSVTSEDSEAATMVKIIGNLAEFNAELNNAEGKLVVVDFSATWCGPCKMIKPFYHSLAEKYPDVIFIEIDVDEASDVSQHCDVKCMPTFHFYKNNDKVHEFSGANKEKLEEAIKKYK